MISITRRGFTELEIGSEFDKDDELEVTILNDEGNDVSVWLTKEEVKQLIIHLQNIS